jgi:hypothetical protein
MVLVPRAVELQLDDLAVAGQERLDLGDKFRATLGGDVVIGLPFVLEVKNRDTRILTEAVVSIEVGNVPEMVFG